MNDQEQKLKDFLMDYATIDEMDAIAICLDTDNFEGADKIITAIMERIEK